MAIIKLTIKEVLEVISGELIKGDPETNLTEIYSGQSKGAIYFSFKGQSIPVCCLVTDKNIEYPDADNVVKVKNARLAFAHLLDFISKSEMTKSISKSAYVAETCNIADNVHIGNNVVLHDNVSIESGVVVSDNVVIMADACVQENAFIMPNVTVYPKSQIGKNTTIHANSVIGADGFGFERQANGKWFKIHHIGRVVIGDEVEIGANVSIDRGTISDTIIADGCKIDNHCQIGHNVSIGKNSIISGCTGIAGSSKISENVILGGRVSVSDHVTIAPNVIVKGASTVVKDITKPGVYGSAINVLPSYLWNKCMLLIYKLPLIYKLTKKVEFDDDTNKFT